MKLLIVYPEDDLHSFIDLSLQKNGFYHNKNKEPTNSWCHLFKKVNGKQLFPFDDGKNVIKSITNLCH